MTVTLGLTLIGAIGLAIVGPWLIPLLFSSRFKGSYVPMVALLPGVILLGGGKVLTNDIAGRGHPEYNSITSGLALGLTVGLTVWLIPKYGILGASLASTIAYSTAFLASLVVYRKISRRSDGEDGGLNPEAVDLDVLTKETTT